MHTFYIQCENNLHSLYNIINKLARIRLETFGLCTLVGHNLRTVPEIMPKR